MVFRSLETTKVNRVLILILAPCSITFSLMLMNLDGSKTFGMYFGVIAITALIIAYYQLSLEAETITISEKSITAQFKNKSIEIKLDEIKEITYGSRAIHIESTAGKKVKFTKYFQVVEDSLSNREVLLYQIVKSNSPRPLLSLVIVILSLDLNTEEYLSWPVEYEAYKKGLS